MSVRSSLILSTNHARAAGAQVACFCYRFFYLYKFFGAGFFGAGAGDAADAAGHANLFFYLLMMLVRGMQRALLVAMEYHLCLTALPPVLSALSVVRV